MTRTAADRLCPADLRDELIALRHDLHRHPELAFQETRTAGRLQETLTRLEPVSLSRVTETGVVARIRGRDANGPLVAIRGDIDALPIQEATEAEFASVHDGVMHACGHDVHATWAVGAAALLTREPAVGDVLIILQPAEETGQGASRLIEAGVLDGVAAIFGAHVDLRLEVGTVVAQPGPLAAAADTFEIEILGRGAHAARPHEGADPIVAAAALVTALQTLVSRRLAPGVPGVVTVGAFNAGSAPNIIPDTARLTGTLRALDPATRRTLCDGIESVARDVTAGYGVHTTVTVHRGTAPLINDEEAATWAREAAVELLGEGAVLPLPVLNMAGEDFASYLEHIRGCFLRIGARLPEQEPVPAHTGAFLPADDAIFVGAAVLAGAARTASVALTANRV